MPAGVNIYVGDNKKPDNPKTCTSPRAGRSTFPIKIDATAVPNGQYFGWIKLVPSSGANPVFMPIAFVKKQGTATMTNSCSPTSIPASNGTFTAGLSHCTVSVSNLGSTTSNVTLGVAQAEKGKALKYKNITLPGSVVGSGEGVQWSGPLSPAVPPQVNSLTPTPARRAGTCRCRHFGIAPIAGVGDDTITNFNVPTFYYGGEPYTRVGVVSNGYLVVGGGDSGDIVFTPQHFPNPNRPNNVLALWWSDLNPSASGAGAIRIGTLTDGSRTWLVVDWAGVKNFGDANDTHVRDLDPARPGRCRNRRFE